MIDVRLITEMREAIIPNGNGSSINIVGTRIAMGIGTTTATDSSYFMDNHHSNLHGARDGYYPISESNLKTLLGAAEVDLTPVKAQIDKEREREREERETEEQHVVVMKVEEKEQKKYK